MNQKADIFFTNELDLVAYLQVIKKMPVVSKRISDRGILEFGFDYETAHEAGALDWSLQPSPQMQVIQDVLRKKNDLINYCKEFRRG